MFCDQNNVLYFLTSLFFVLFLIPCPQNVYCQNNGTPSYIQQISPQQVIPWDGQTDVSVDTSITAIFNDPMDIFNDECILNIAGQAGNEVKGQNIWDQDNLLFVFQPDELLLYNTNYDFYLNLLAYDTYGNLLQAQKNWSFATQLYPWIHYYNVNSLSLSQHSVQAILGADNGELWVTLKEKNLLQFSGVFRFDGTHWHQILESLGTVNDLEKDDTGGIWVATEPGTNNTGGGVHYYDGENWTHYTTNNSNLAENTITCLTIDSHGQIWAGWNSFFSSGISLFDGASWTNYDIPNNWVTDILADDLDYIWIGTQFTDIMGFDPHTYTWTSFSSDINIELGITSFITNTMASDPEHIWIGTNIGLLSYNRITGQWSFFDQEAGYLPDDQCLSLAWEPEDEVLWIGTIGGVINFDGQAWHNIPMANAGPGVEKIGIDSFGYVWMGTDNSLSRYDTSNPSLKSFVPAGNQKDVSISKTIILNFSEPMDSDSVLSSLSFVPSINYTSSWNTLKTQLTLTPKSQLSYDTEYKVTLTNQAKDLFGHPMTNGYSWSFRTAKKETTSNTQYQFSYPGFSVGNFSSGFNLGNFSTNFSLGNFSTNLNLNSFASYNVSSYTNFRTSSSFSNLSTGLNFNAIAPINLSMNTFSRSLVPGGMIFNSYTSGPSSNLGFTSPQTFSLGNISNLFNRLRGQSSLSFTNTINPLSQYRLGSAFF